uniref:Uncharacterized protein n=1 Tax=Oryza brachyantha TaxID=4533 RepID=J3N729_ORYBR
AWFGLFEQSYNSQEGSILVLYLNSLQLFLSYSYNIRELQTYILASGHRIHRTNVRDTINISRCVPSKQRRRKNKQGSIGTCDIYDARSLHANESWSSSANSSTAERTPGAMWRRRR